MLVRTRWLAVTAVAAVAGAIGGFTAAEVSHPTSVPARTTPRRSSDQEVRAELAMLQSAEVEVLMECMPKLMIYVNTLTNGGDASKTLTPPCVRLFYPNGAPGP